MVRGKVYDLEIPIPFLITPHFSKIKVEIKWNDGENIFYSTDRSGKRILQTPISNFEEMLRLYDK